jgi:hypothetical protein
MNFVCEICDYNTSYYSNYKRHIHSKKHNDNNDNKMITKDNAKTIKAKNVCKCKKIFTYQSNLIRHRKKCKIYQKFIEDEENGEHNDADENENIEEEETQLDISKQERTSLFKLTEILCRVLAENTELQNQLLQQQREMIEQDKKLHALLEKQCETISTAICTTNPNHSNNSSHKNIQNHNSHNTLNHNSHNTTNNYIQFFLDNKCKNAMTIQSFANNLQVSLEDIEQKKYECLSNVILNNLKPLPITERPVHCANPKKKEWFINNKEQGWEKNTGDELIRQTEFGISKKLSAEFNAKHPNWTEIDSLKDKFMKLIHTTTSELPDKVKSKLLNELAHDLQITQDIVETNHEDET